MSVRYSDITFRPIDTWPGEQTAWRERARFSASWLSTISLLERELTFLNAKNVVFQVALYEGQLRIDGKPKANARASHPGVVLAFDSKFGPLKYAVDTYDSFPDNVRAIALAMDALRSVDRYGVTKRGEQYTGWRAIPQTTGVESREQAFGVIAEFGGSVRAALMATHPDRGGDPDDFQRVMRAKELLEA